MVLCPFTFFGIPKRVKRLVLIYFEFKGPPGTTGGFLCLLFLPKCSSSPFKASVEGVGFGSPSHLHACVSRVDFSRVQKRRGCRFSRTTVGFVEEHPRASSDVTHSAFRPYGL